MADKSGSSKNSLLLSFRDWRRAKFTRHIKFHVSEIITLVSNQALSAGLTQEDLAECAEVSVRFISMLETGKRQPSLSALAALSAGLRMPMSMLVAAIERNVCILGDDAEQSPSAELDDHSEIAG